MQGLQLVLESVGAESESAVSRNNESTMSVRRKGCTLRESSVHTASRESEGVREDAHCSAILHQRAARLERDELYVRRPD